MNSTKINFRTPRTTAGTAMEIAVGILVLTMWVLIIYLSLENPEGNLDRQTGLFRREVLKSYLQQLYGQEKDFAVLVLLFDRGQRTPRRPAWA